MANSLTDDREAQVAALTPSEERTERAALADALAASPNDEDALMEARIFATLDAVRAAHPDPASKVAAAIPGPALDVALEAEWAAHRSWQGHRIDHDLCPTCGVFKRLRGALGDTEPGEREPKPTSTIGDDGELEVLGLNGTTRTQLDGLIAEFDLIEETSPAQDHEAVAEWTRG